MKISKLTFFRNIMLLLLLLLLLLKLNKIFLLYFTSKILIIKNRGILNKAATTRGFFFLQTNMKYFRFFLN